MNEEKTEDNKDKIPEENQEENFILQYSPRTEYSMKLEEEEKMYNELKLNFDPITIKIIKKHFKERLGALKKEEMVAILKNHLLGFLPNHPNREKIIVKLLLRLFSDIDLNDNGDLEWNEFTNYIVHLGSDNNKVKSKDYRLKFYAKSLYSINPSDLTEQITYAFCLEKHNVIGIVQEGKSNILFYETKKCKKLKCYIDLKDIQAQVDILEFSELNKRANKILEKEEIEKRIKKLQLNSKNNKHRRSAYLSELNNENLKHKKKKEDEKKSNNTNNSINNNEILSKGELIKTSINKKLSILCTCFIPEYDIILVSGTNNTITAWKFIKQEIKNVNVTQDFRLSKDELRIAILIADSPQYAMCWDPALKLLFTGQKDGKILKWDLTKPNPIIEDILDIKIVKKKSNNPNLNIDKENNNKDNSKKLLEQIKQKSFKNVKENDLILFEDKDKNMSVSCLLLSQKLQLLAASYYNGNIILWDTLLKDYRKCYTDQTTGIYSMAFDSIRNLIFTCGFSHDIFVYDPYIDGSSVYKLIGHNWSINSIECNEKESELISVDILGTIKVWDTSLLINFQTIKLNEQIEDNNSKKNHNMENSKNKKLSSNMKMLYINKLKKIFVYGNKLLFFETDRANNPELADDQVICSCYYDKTAKTLLSFCLRKIKIWNILTGKVKQIYDDPMGGEVTAIIVDRNVKRGFLGDNTGKIRNINLKNGQIIKDLTPHSTEIKFLCHSMSLNIIASCSIDNIIKIHNDAELLETEVIKELSIFQFQVRALCIVDRFSRLGIGLSNGIIKFYDIEHFHYDSDLQSDPSIIKDEVSALAAIDGVELVLCCYSSGICRFIVTPPSAVKFSSIYEFNNCNDKLQPIAISSIEFDKVNHLVFIGDLLGNIKCYNISEIYDIINNVIENEQRNFDNETIITKENYDLFTNIKIVNLWSIEAHKESIRHIHYVDIEPRIIITTSHDLRIKIFEAETGKYQDEFRQISNRIKPVPIGIKFYLLDPFSDDSKIKSEPLYFYRKDIEKFNPMIHQENSNQQISEYSKKITEFNAKEKLWVNCRNSNLPYQMSNNWNLKINVDKVLENEEIEYQKTFKVVKEVEKITNETELILQEKSIYSDTYKPKYIEEMTDLEQIKEFSKVIAERLRNVKLAVSKANLNQSKMIDLTRKEFGKKMNKSRSSINIKKNSFIQEINKKSSNKSIINDNNKSMIKLKNNLVPTLPKIKSKYNFIQTKINTPGDMFNKLHDDFKNGYSQLFLPFRILIMKSKRQNKLLIRSKSQNDLEERDKRINENELRIKRLTSLEGYLKHLEQMQ